MKKTYKYLTTVALNGALCLFVALSANAQHRGSSGSSSSGSSSGSSSPRSSGGSSSGGSSRPAPSSNGGGFRPSPGSSNVSRPQGGGSRPSFNGGAQRSSIGVAYARPGNNNGNSRVAISPPRANPGFSVATAHRTYNPGAYSYGDHNYVNNTARSYVGTRGYIGAGGRASVGVGGRGFYGPAYWRTNGYYHYHRGYYGTYYAPRLGFSIGYLSPGYYPFTYGDAEFYYSSGLFYQYQNDEYTVVEPPVGAEINSLPSNAQSIMINGVQYYEANGVYYEPITKDDGSVSYQVAGKDGELNTSDPNGDGQQAPQVGDIVETLPPDCRKISLNGEKYFVSADGYYYQESRDANNNKVYKIVGTPEDAPQDQQ